MIYPDYTLKNNFCNLMTLQEEKDTSHKSRRMYLIFKMYLVLSFAPFSPVVGASKIQFNMGVCHSDKDKI